MRVLHEALRPLGAFNQFVLYATRPDPQKPGKNKKFPVSVDGVPIDCHSPANWMPLQTALEVVQTKPENWGVAFVLTAADPFFFIDVDSALVNDQWSQMARGLCEAFAGCAVEVSNSGTGLHIIGTGQPGPHGCRNKNFNLEFYTEKRFIALTGLHASGSAGYAARPECLAWLVDNYFPATQTVNFEGWTDGPCEEWNGPTDDGELIRRAMASQSAGSTFGKKASFADLWTCNLDVLSKVFPADSSNTDPYNGSVADSALASHLAFWTGRDCARIERLMRQSALVRGKWDDREDYLERTILGACGVNTDVLSDKQVEPPSLAAALPVSPVTPARPAPEAHLIEGSVFVSPEQQLEMWRGHVYIRDQNAIFVPHAGGEVMGPSVFNVAYGGYKFIMTRENGAKEPDAFKAFTQSNAVRHLQVASTCFRPKLPPGTIVQESGRDLINIYMPVETPRLVGDPTPFFTHLEKLLPVERDRQILLAYMAACVQYKGHKFQWAPLVQGTEGNGKSLFTRCVAFAIGSKYTHWPKASKLSAQFNSWMYGKLFYGVEDIYTPSKRAEVIEELKDMITNEQLEIESKGMNQVTRDVCGNFMFNSNHKDAVRKAEGDRRYCVMYTAQQSADDLAAHGMTGNYMPRLYAWLKGEGEFAQHGADYGYRIVNELLHTWPIPPEFDPTGACHRAPTTSSTPEVLLYGRNIIESEILEAIEEGREGFSGGYISGVYLKRLFDELRVSIPPARRKLILDRMGYVLHPRLKDGRTDNVVKPDCTRPVLYVKVGHPSAGAKVSPAEVASDYTLSQQGGKSLLTL